MVENWAGLKAYRKEYLMVKYSAGNSAHRLGQQMGCLREAKMVVKTDG
jgi:hypothetical protein